MKAIQTNVYNYVVVDNEGKVVGKYTDYDKAVAHSQALSSYALLKSNLGPIPTPKPTLKIEFDNEETLRNFALWLCGAGEQDYWEWMKYREEETEGQVTAVQFEYHGGKKDAGIEDFISDLTIRTTSGRMDTGWK